MRDTRAHTSGRVCEFLRKKGCKPPSRKPQEHASPSSSLSSSSWVAEREWVAESPSIKKKSKKGWGAIFEPVYLIKTGCGNQRERRQGRRRRRPSLAWWSDLIMKHFSLLNSSFMLLIYAMSIALLRMSIEILLSFSLPFLLSNETILTSNRSSPWTSFQEGKRERE